MKACNLYLFVGKSLEFNVIDGEKSAQNMDGFVTHLHCIRRYCY